MAGLYIHIPYCKQACYYCDFHFSTNLGTSELLISCLLKEIESRSNELTEEISSIYFGGGTPSIVPVNYIGQILNQIADNYRLSERIEVSLEANPDDISKQSLDQWKDLGINRFSLGVQSFNDEILKWMNRSHSAAEGRAAINLMLDQGFESSTIDLIYGFPRLSTIEWERSLDEVYQSGIRHLSAYNLTIEENTVFHRRIQKGQEKKLNDEYSDGQFHMLMERMSEEKWHHYEISNYCQKGYESIHNSNYWNRTPYLGFGPSAHSFKGNSRRWNISNNPRYIKLIGEGEKFFETEELSPRDEYNEKVLLGLRRSQGVDLSGLNYKLSGNQEIEKEHCLEEFVTNEWIERKGAVVRLTRKGKSFADHIASSLFLE